MNFHRTLSAFIHILPLALFVVALAIVHSELKTHDIHAIVGTLKTTSWFLICAAIIITVLNYIVLAGYDWLALRYTGHKDIPTHRILGASLIGYGISNNTGHAWASGGAVRYRF